MARTARSEKTVVSRGKRVYFDCARCGAPTDAVPETLRAAGILCRDCNGKRKDLRPKDLNELTGKEWAHASLSLQAYPDTRSDKQREHGASFPMSLAKQQIEIYTKSGDLVLDPFVGVGTTLDACAALGRRGIGVEINKRFARLAEVDIKKARAKSTQKLIVGDACRLSEFIAPNSVDFLLTSPPYGALLKNVKGAFAFKWKEHSKINSIPNPAPYSQLEADLGNLEYPDFLARLSVCFTETKKVLRKDAYAVWVVKDYRALKSGVPYVNFHGDVIGCAEAAGLQLWDIRIFDQTKHRPLVCLGYPSRNFYLNIGHSYLLVFRKR